MLSDIEARKAKPKDKPYKLTDERGLYLLVNPNGGKLWRMNYRFDAKQKTLSFGVYPDVSLKDARDRRDEARKQIAAGIDPGEHRKAEKAAKDGRAANSFEIVAREFMANNAARWSESHHLHVKQCLERDVFPWLGARAVGEITAPELLTVLKRIQERGALETAHRTKQFVGQAMRYAVVTGRAERDPSADLRGALPTPRAKHHATITDPKAVGNLLRAIESYPGSFVTRCAFRLAPLLFVRPGELVEAEWSEFDLDAGEWRIPSERMKMRDRHIVPLARQAVEILRELYPLSGSGRFVFPGARDSKKPMSRETILQALRNLGYGTGDMTSHGFRGMASTLLHEQGWNTDIIERQLAHAETNKVKAAYNHAEHLPERRKMMQAWADYLDGLRKGADVIPFKRAG